MNPPHGARPARRRRTARTAGRSARRTARRAAGRPGIHRGDGEVKLAGDVAEDGSMFAQIPQPSVCRTRSRRRPRRRQTHQARPSSARDTGDGPLWMDASGHTVRRDSRRPIQYCFSCTHDWCSSGDKGLRPDRDGADLIGQGSVAVADERYRAATRSRSSRLRRRTSRRSGGRARRTHRSVARGTRTQRSGAIAVVSRGSARSRAIFTSVTNRSPVGYSTTKSARPWIRLRDRRPRPARPAVVRCRRRSLDLGSVPQVGVEEVVEDCLEEREHSLAFGLADRFRDRVHGLVEGRAHLRSCRSNRPFVDAAGDQFRERVVKTSSPPPRGRADRIGEGDRRRPVRRRVQRLAQQVGARTDPHPPSAGTLCWGSGMGPTGRAGLAVGGIQVASSRPVRRVGRARRANRSAPIVDADLVASRFGSESSSRS